MTDSTFFSEFQKPSILEWKEVLVKELKGKPYDDLLVKNLEIEDLTFESALSIESNLIPISFQNPRASNAWINEAYIDVLVDTKATNAKALHFLMSGATGLRFVFSETTPDLDILFENIGFEYIHTAIDCKSEEQINFVSNYLESKNAQFTILNEMQFLNYESDNNNQTVRADILQQAGANASQELNYALLAGHEVLKKHIALGKSITDSNKLIHFNFGIGNNYLVEIAKFRAFQGLWQCVLHNYDKNFKGKANVSVQTTVVNKSLKDPHTNMLRQTTEAMSAVLGGVDRLCIIPYDTYSINRSNPFSERMSLNISNILAEESYLDIVNDPAKGSYAIDHFLQLLTNKAWSYFQKWNNFPFNETMTQLQLEVKAKSNIRISRFQEKKDQLIGINVYPSPKPIENSWNMEVNLFFPALILEQY